MARTVIQATGQHHAPTNQADGTLALDRGKVVGLPHGQSSAVEFRNARYDTRTKNCHDGAFCPDGWRLFYY